MLIVGDDTLEKLEYVFGSFDIDNDNEVPEDDFKPKREIFHTFRPDIKPVHPLIPNSFTLLTLSPWLVLLGLVSSFI